jgi:hypothetical protein
MPNMTCRPIRRTLPLGGPDLISPWAGRSSSRSLFSASRQPRHRDRRLQRRHFPVRTQENNRSTAAVSAAPAEINPAVTQEDTPMVYTGDGGAAEPDPHRRAAEQAFRAGQRAELARREARAAQRAAADSLDNSADRQDRAKAFEEAAEHKRSAGRIPGTRGSPPRVRRGGSPGWLSSCDKRQKVTRWAIPPHLRTGADDSRKRTHIPHRY